MNSRILFVDDDENLLAGIQRKLRKVLPIDIALGGEQALVMMAEHGPYAVVVADMQMPCMNGVQFLVKATERSPDTVRMMLTGNADQKTAMDAVNQGHIFRFLTKPCDTETLVLVLQAGLRQYQLVTAERDLLESTLNGSITILTDMLAVLDPHSFALGQRLCQYMMDFSQTYPMEKVWELELTAMLAQIGCVTVPAPLLRKAREGQQLTEAEAAVLNRIPEIGYQLLCNIPRMESVANAIRYQSKNFDGTGFPADAVAGEEIPIGARLVRVLRDLLIMESNHISPLKALTKMRACAGRYDLRVLESVARAFDVELPAAESTDAAGRSVSVRELEVGQILKQDIRTADGVLLISAGMAISSVLLVKLQNWAALGHIGEQVSLA